MKIVGIWLILVIGVEMEICNFHYPLNGRIKN